MIKPSEVLLTDRPLIGMLKDRRVEEAVAVIVRCCQLLGNEWREVTIDEFKNTLIADGINHGTITRSWAMTPSFKPNFREALRVGFLEGKRTELSPGFQIEGPYKIPEKTLALLEKYVKDTDVKPYVDGELP